MLYSPSCMLLHLRHAKVGWSKAGHPCRRSCARPLNFTHRACTLPTRTYRVGFFLSRAAVERCPCLEFPSAFSARPAWSASSSSPCSPTIRGSRSTGSAPASARKARRFATPPPGGCRTACPTTSPSRVVEAAAPGQRAEAGVLRARFVGRRRDRSAPSPQAGHIVVSNSRNYRMFDTVPLLIPEVNADHLTLLDAQARGAGLEGPHRHQPELRRRSCSRWRWRRCASSA